ncbi:hypothetical protein Leryth_025675 [Lithospermum erythrorhizon]|nr:hypothetical protein Leryth_025675 [Lithospermum erythrorhizon]
MLCYDHLILIKVQRTEFESKSKKQNLGHKTKRMNCASYFGKTPCDSEDIRLLEVKPIFRIKAGSPKMVGFPGKGELFFWGQIETPESHVSFERLDPGYTHLLSGLSLQPLQFQIEGVGFPPCLLGECPALEGTGPTFVVPPAGYPAGGGLPVEFGGRVPPGLHWLQSQREERQIHRLRSRTRSTFLS